MNKVDILKKYNFKEPQFSTFWSPILGRINDYFYLKNKYKVANIKISGATQELKKFYRRNCPIMVTPNHSDHSDPHVLMHLSRQYNIPLNYVAAKEIFELGFSNLRAKILQKSGVFSIDREGNDISAIKQAIKTIEQAKYPLVMFPEGEIYHMNKKLTPLNVGPATIMLKVAQKAEKKQLNKQTIIAPIAISYTYNQDLTPILQKSMQQLEQHFNIKTDNTLALVKRLHNLANLIITQKEQQLYKKTFPTLPLEKRLQNMQNEILHKYEIKYYQKIQDGEFPFRIRRLRGHIRDQYKQTTNQSQKQNLLKELDATYLALQLYSYIPSYIMENPCQDRIAETIIKLEEDIFDISQIHGTRDVEVTCCKPIIIEKYLLIKNKTHKEIAQQITTDIAKIIQKTINKKSAKKITETNPQIKSISNLNQTYTLKST